MATSQKIRQQLIDQVKQVSCFDEEERATQARMLAWLATTPELCRLSSKPDYPTQHIACFNVCVTPERQKVLLFEHNKSGLLLTCGGHLDQNEMLQQCVVREMQEEMGINIGNYTERPFFISELDTNMPTGYHWEPWFLILLSEDTDVTKGKDYHAEFSGHRWYSLEEAILLDRAHPHFARLIKKLLQRSQSFSK